MTQNQYNAQLRPPQRPTKTVSVTVRKRGFFGHVFRILFYVFNALMLWWFGSYLYFFFNAGLDKTKSSAELAGTAIGGFMGTGLIIMIWLVGLIVFGGLMLATRGKLVTTTQEVNSR